MRTSVSQSGWELVAWNLLTMDTELLSHFDSHISISLCLTGLWIFLFCSWLGTWTLSCTYCCIYLIWFSCSTNILACMCLERESMNSTKKPDLQGCPATMTFCGRWTPSANAGNTQQFVKDSICSFAYSCQDATAYPLECVHTTALLPPYSKLPCQLSMLCIQLSCKPVYVRWRWATLRRSRTYWGKHG